MSEHYLTLAGLRDRVRIEKGRALEVLPMLTDTFDILFIDALVYKLKGRSLLMSDRLEFLVLAVISIAVWWLCEFYNAPRFWKSNQELWWHYHNLEPNPFVRRAGYDWAFATIFPAMFETAELFMLKVFRRENIRVISNTRLLGAKCRGRLKEINFEHCGSKRKVVAHVVRLRPDRTSPPQAPAGSRPAHRPTEPLRCSRLPPAPCTSAAPR